MRSIEILCPAKINLTLEVTGRREDGFHNIKSIMQLISLYDCLNIEVCEESSICLSGSSNEIPYDEKNLVYKAAKLFLEYTGKSSGIRIHIEKNIPISAGLAGGSTDAAGTLYGLNQLFDTPLNQAELHSLCESLGSDLNVCLEGGCMLATSRGEKIEKLPCVNMPVTLIKPKYLGISAKEAYSKYDLKEFKPHYNMTEKMAGAIKHNSIKNEFLYNDLEYAVFDDYTELQQIKAMCPAAVMSGSGSTFFVLEDCNPALTPDYQIIRNLHFINSGVQVCNNFVTN